MIHLQQSTNLSKPQKTSPYQCNNNQHNTGTTTTTPINITKTPQAFDDEKKNDTKDLSANDHNDNCLINDRHDEQEQDDMRIDSDFKDYPPTLYKHVLPKSDDIISYSRWTK